MKWTSRLSRSSLATATGHLALLGLCQRGRELRAAVERVGTFAGLDLDELSGDLEALALGEPGNGGALRL